MADRYNPFNVNESDIVIVDDSGQITDPIIQPTVNPPVLQTLEPTIIDTLVGQKPIEQPIESPVIQEKTVVIQPTLEELDEEDGDLTVEEIKVEPIQEKVNEKSKQYLDIIKEYINNEGLVIREQLPDRTETITNILDETYQRPKVPVYTYGKDIKTGNITIESKKTTKTETLKKEELPELKDTIARQELQKMIEEVNRNIIRTKIELRIHVELVRNATLEQQKLYEIKIKSYKEDLEYYTKRKSILERM